MILASKFKVDGKEVSMNRLYVPWITSPLVDSLSWTRPLSTRHIICENCKISSSFMATYAFLTWSTKYICSESPYIWS